MSLRDTIHKAGPAWLVRDRFSTDGGLTEIETDARVLYALVLVLDELATRQAMGSQAKWPSYAPTDALALLGRDRLILRGPSEAAAAYRTRLLRWLDDHQVRGNPWALMEQIRGYCSPHAIKVRTVDEHGNWRLINDVGTRSRSNGDTWNWDNSALTVAWGRFWLVIEPRGGTLPWEPEPTWGTGTWGDGGTWGTTATPNEVAGVRSIVKAWKRAGVKCVYVIISFSGSSFVPAAVTNPDGSPSWAGYSTNSGGTQVRARDPNGRYWRA